jgi:hypothetical protein
MNIVQFLEATRRDQELIAKGITPAGMDACEECGKPLQSGITGRHMLGDGMQICGGCYADLMSAHLDEHPIRALRLAQRGLGKVADVAANNTGNTDEE